MNDRPTAPVTGDSLLVRLSDNPLHRALFGDPKPGHAQEHLGLIRRLSPLYHRIMAANGVAAPSPDFLCDVIVPLVRFIEMQAGLTPHTYLLGLAGGPGAGKSTLSRLLAACLKDAAAQPLHALSLSLDDFYLAKAERLRRGFKWRTLPGTHDTDRLGEFTKALDRRDGVVVMPRYDLARDQPLPDEVYAAPPDICIFDGAMVGSRLPGYDSLSARLDFLIYLDAPIAQLKTWRFSREERFRAQSGGKAGFSPDEMNAFWKEALLPSIVKWVKPNAAIADLVVRISPARTVLSAQRRAPNHPNTKATSHG